MASTTSAYLVAIPKSADTHIQKSAPGPPEAMAVATPTMLPVPAVAASAVVMACSGVTDPRFACFCFLNNAPSVTASMCENFLNWTAPVLSVYHTPVPSSSANTTGPQTNPFTAPLILASQLDMPIALSFAYAIIHV
ncbi:hypothetical protein SDC9_126253 [bioreactor metagenome]|uniref:Uncharacterized protein n=1 Tax=bioreactor metagenome TaxID=1076179 RepID=A0A645CQ49_9ZZZZ